MIINELLVAAGKYAGEMRAIRRDLHRFPELGFQEFRTTEKIREHLSRLSGIRFRDLPGLTGVVAELPGKSPRTVALRADIDALPITEENTHDYISVNSGIMHACGHDGHVAILLGAAFLLAEQERPHTVRFIFQPAEEVTPSGAPAFLKAGALENVEAIFGFHLNATSDFGLLGVYDGAVMAGGVAFRITIQGRGGHAAYPEKCVNPIYTAVELIPSLDRIKDLIHPSMPCSIVPVKLTSGDYENRIPDLAVLEGRMKYLDIRARDIFCEELAVLTERCGAKNRTECRLEIHPKLPITFNSPELGQHVVLPAARQLGLDSVQILPSMGSDDFGYYSECIPGFYMTFGIRKGENFPIAHTAVFDFDEKILPVGAAQMAACAIQCFPAVKNAMAFHD